MLNTNIKKLLNLERPSIGSNQRVAHRKSDEIGWVESMARKNPFLNDKIDSVNFKISKIKEIQNTILKCVEDINTLSINKEKNKELIEIIQFKKSSKIKERNKLAQTLPEQERTKLELEIIADFSVSIN